MWPADGEPPLHSGRSYGDHEKHDRKLQITGLFFFFSLSEARSRFLSYLLNLSSSQVLKDSVRYEKPAPSLHLLETHPPFIRGFYLIAD